MSECQQMWPKWPPNKAKSSKSGCRMSTKRNPFQRRFKFDTVGVNLEVIWAMSVSSDKANIRGIISDIADRRSVIRGDDDNGQPI